MRLPGVSFTAGIALVLLLAALPVRAADEPEAVYAKFHRAAMGGDLDEMLNHGLAQRRAEMRGLSAAHREAQLKMVRLMMPRAYALERKTVRPKGSATLIVSGTAEGGSGTQDAVYGTVQMLLENGAWKVDEVSWNSEKPAILATPKPSPAPAAGKAAAVSTKGAPVVGSMSSQVSGGGGKLGPAKPECVYKPVMTARDMENCR